ncbi:MAG: DUF559 domain-containing protein [Hyphomicrobium aestuarii]|nr:DUF559 domain-containing protein [Hyphomicrobium aestuarii]
MLVPSASYSAHLLMATHDRLRESGFGIVTVVSARSAIDGRIWSANWARANSRNMVVAPSTDAEAALYAYTHRAAPPERLATVPSERRPLLLVPGKLDCALPVAMALIKLHPALPVTIICSLSDIVETLMQPKTPLSHVSAALEGLVAIEDAERQVLKTVADGRQLQPFMRGPSEGLVYYMLEARSETRGRFEANARLPSTHGARRHEVDILCQAAQLVVEIDGPEHDNPDRRRLDERKARDLEAQGYRVRRFTNKDVIEDPVGVWRLINEQMQQRLRVEEKIA